MYPPRTPPAFVNCDIPSQELVSYIGTFVLNLNLNLVELDRLLLERKAPPRVKSAAADARRGQDRAVSVSPRTDPVEMAGS